MKEATFSEMQRAFDEWLRDASGSKMRLTSDGQLHPDERRLLAVRLGISESRIEYNADRRLIIIDDRGLEGAPTPPGSRVTELGELVDAACAAVDAYLTVRDDLLGDRLPSSFFEALDRLEELTRTYAARKVRRA